jgi:plastocyanin
MAVLALFLCLLLASCGSGSSSPPGPSPSNPNTFTITAAGVSPKELTVQPGTRVLFVNSDSRRHEMTSDPHPEHTDCTEINSVGALSPGQGRETGNLVDVRTCGFHDHGEPDNSGLKGRIIIR